jgi:hypothetical protein
MNAAGTSSSAVSRMRTIGWDAATAISALFVREVCPLKILPSPSSCCSKFLTWGSKANGQFGTGSVFEMRCPKP